MNTKTCKVCLEEKDISNFEKRKTPAGTFYFRSECKDCKRIINNKYYLNNKNRINTQVNNFRIENPLIIKERKQAYYEKNKDKINNKTKKYYIKNKNIINAKKKIFYVKNKDRINAQKLGYQKSKEMKDPCFKLRRRVSNMIYISLKNDNCTKNNFSILCYLQYSIEELKLHLESLFEQWMTWSNWGNFNLKTWDDNDQSTWTWQIDHIIPHSTFKYTSMEDEKFKKCWALENLRPYSAKQNIIDGSIKIRHINDGVI
jgi:hypothetical protein